MTPLAAQEPRRFVGLWSLIASVALHVVLLARVLSRPEPPAQTPAARSDSGATPIQWFEASVGSSARPPAMPTRAPARPMRTTRFRAKEDPARAVPRLEEGSPPEASAAPAEAVSAAVEVSAPLERAVAVGSPGGRGGSGSEARSAPSSEAAEAAAASTRQAVALDALHRRLAAAALRCYPPAARRFRAQGEVVVSFCLDASGSATSMSQVTSSGSALLDRAALDCVLPGALPTPGAPGCYRIPILFGAAP